MLGFAKPKSAQDGISARLVSSVFAGSLARCWRAGSDHKCSWSTPSFSFSFTTPALPDRQLMAVLEEEFGGECHAAVHTTPSGLRGLRASSAGRTSPVVKMPVCAHTCWTAGCPRLTIDLLARLRAWAHRSRTWSSVPAIFVPSQISSHSCPEAFLTQGCAKWVHTWCYLHKVDSVQRRYRHLWQCLWMPWARSTSAALIVSLDLFLLSWGSYSWVWK